MSQKQNFIKTTDKETADKLISEGFQFVSQSGNVYTFLNDISKNFNFANFDKSKIAYTNTLNI